LTTDGPYVEGKEHIGGFTIIQAPDLDAALEWASRHARVLAPLAIEVRPLADDEH
ncbi:MAG: YciI family protein, partial [Micromonosporaceae bacterium]